LQFRIRAIVFGPALTSGRYQDDDFDESPSCTRIISMKKAQGKKRMFREEGLFCCSWITHCFSCHDAGENAGRS